jgi:hypothetical protein
MTTHHRHLGVLSALLLAAGACIGPPGSVASDDMGILSASLTLSPTALLNTANYAISGPNAFARSGSIDVSHSETASATIGGIPAGNDYKVNITGTATDGLTTCSGAATFSITPKVTTILSIKIQCREPARTGGVQINGTVNVCPVVDAVGANAGEVMVGSSSAISSAAHDSDARPALLTYSWVATSGMLAGATTPNPTLFCTTAGVSTITLTVSDGDCTDTGSLSITCLPAPAGAAIVRINEVESNGGMPGDWVELINVGGSTADLSGWRFRDNDPARVTAPAIIPAGTMLPPGGYYVLNEIIGGMGQFTFGLGGADSATIFDATEVVVDTFSWTAHATITYGRCANGIGAFAQSSSTKGAANDCGDGMAGMGGDGGGATGAAGTTGGATGTAGGAGTTGMAGSTGTAGGGAAGMGGMGGSVAALPWPGDDAVVTVDEMNQFTGNLSGLTYQPATASSPAVIWAVLNSPSLLFRLVWNGTTFADTATDGWAAGKTLHYPTGLGAPDAEGVTKAELESSAIYVGSERDNLASAVSRLVILRYDTDAAGTELTATNDWDITADLPAAGANLGIEAITWVPDSYLVAKAFVDESTGAAYDPGGYPAHGTGLFFVGIEGTGNIYGYALNHVTGAFQRVATVASGNAGVMGMEFDRDAGNFWAYCDNTCGNRSSILRIGATGRFEAQRFYIRPASLPDSNNEGIAIAPESECAGGLKSFFWADDSNFGAHALRRGAISCGPLF